MKNTDLKLLFEGTKAIDKTEKLLWSLYKKMMHDASHTEAERAFFLAFEARELLNSDGFESCLSNLHHWNNTQTRWLR